MQPTKGKRTKPVATSIIYDFMFNINPESWETKDASKEARRVAQISWIIEVAALNVSFWKCQMVRVGGSHHLNILRGRGTKCQLSACHTNTSAPITSDSNPDTDARIKQLFQIRIFFTSPQYIYHINTDICEFENSQTLWKQILSGQSFLWSNCILPSISTLSS